MKKPKLDAHPDHRIHWQQGVPIHFRSYLKFLSIDAVEESVLTRRIATPEREIAELPVDPRTREEAEREFREGEKKWDAVTRMP